MKEIQLTRGYVALVDDSDYERVSQFKWYVQLTPHTAYARRRTGKVRQWMHRFILGATDRGLAVDHADRNGLNNQRSNLRIATRSQNKANSVKQKGTYTSHFKGVSFHTKTKKWQAYITANGKRIYLGLFVNEMDAAAAYRAAASEAFGAFMRACKKRVKKHKS